MAVVVLLVVVLAAAAALNVLASRRGGVPAVPLQAEASAPAIVPGGAFACLGGQEDLVAAARFAHEHAELTEDGAAEFAGTIARLANTQPAPAGRDEMLAALFVPGEELAAAWAAFRTPAVQMQLPVVYRVADFDGESGRVAMIGTMLVTNPGQAPKRDIWGLAFDVRAVDGRWRIASPPDGNAEDGTDLHTAMNHGATYQGTCS